MKKKTFYPMVISLLFVTMLLSACGGSAAPASPADQPVAQSGVSSTGNAEAGGKLFSACAACHGPQGKGVSGLGSNLPASDFVKSKTDAELVAFIRAGRSVGDPANKTGIAMPASGGNPSLTDQNLFDIVAYMRTLKR